MLEQTLSAAWYHAGPVLLVLILVAAAIMLAIWSDSDLYKPHG